MLILKRFVSLCLVFMFLFTLVLFENINYTIVNATPIVIFVDNADTTGFSTDGSTWPVSSTSPQKYLNDYAYDGTSGADAGRWAKWTPNITTAGYYDISMWWPASTGRPDAAPLEIAHYSGIDTSKTVNQQVNGGEWVYIGTYYLSQGTDNYVKIFADDSGLTVADAVKFEAIEAETYYIADSNGDDVNGTGASTNPWKTISRAMQDVGAGDTLIIKEGTYREEVVSKKTGVDGYPITIKAADGENVTISGADPITGWTQHSGYIYKTTIDLLGIGDSRQIFVNDDMMTEARWPNDTDGDLFTFEGFDMEETDGTYIKSSALTQPDGYWNGATLVYGSGSNNAVRSGAVLGNSQQDNKIFYSSSGSPKPSIGSKVFLLGKLEELDSAGEWFYDEGSSTLYFWAPNDANPNILNVKVKTREYAFNLSERSFIDIEGINIFGATIYGANTNNCTIDRINAKYLMHRSVPGPLNTWKDEVPSGLTILGNNNTIKNSEIAYSAFSGIDMNGKNNKIVNNYVHDVGYSGTSASAILLAGRDCLVSNNTVDTCARTALGIYDLQKSVIQYNKLCNSGKLGDDFGTINTSKMDGWNTEIHHNIIYGNSAQHIGAGIYLDNQHSNYIVHHNLVYENNPQQAQKMHALRLNVESYNTLVYNNTFVGGFADHFGGSTIVDSMTGGHVANNIFTKVFTDHTDLVKDNNIYPSLNPNFVNLDNNDYQLSSGSPAINTGIKISGVTDGDAPDIGAFEYGGEDWTLNAGHNFNDSPNLTLAFMDYLYMNRVQNAGFDEKKWLGNAGDGLSEWTKTGTKTASISYAAAPTSTDKDSRYTNTSHHALKLGSGQNGVEQTIAGLLPNTTYNLAGWLRADTGEEIGIGIKSFGGIEIYESVVGGNTWQNKKILFTTGTNNTEATVYIYKQSSGSGNAYADDVSLIFEENRIENIVDNTDSGFTADSSWSVSTATPGYLGVDFAHDGTSGADSSKWAKWTPNIIEGGEYDIYMRWTAATSRPDAAPIEVVHSEGTYNSTVNQTVNGGKWVSIGRYNLSQGKSNYVKILASDAGYTVADAVKFVRAPIIIVDNMDLEFSTDSPWDSSKTTSGYFGANYADDGTLGGDSNKWAQWKPNITESGEYDIYMRWTASTSRPDEAPIQVKYNGGTYNGTVNQTVNGGKWVPIGRFNLSQGTSNDVKILASDSGYTIADAVKFVRAPIYIVDNKDVAFTTEGSSWPVSTSSSGYYGSNYATDGTSGADPSKWAKWTPNIVESGEYNIYMRWTSATNRPDAAPIEVLHSGGTFNSTVNQTENGGQWVLIGNFDLSVGTDNYLKLSASDAGYTIADAVKFVRVITVDNISSDFSTDGSSWPVGTSVTGYYGANYASDNTSGADTGRWAKWTPEIVKSGEYDVYMRWTSAANRPDAAPVEVLHSGGTYNSTVNQTQNGGQWVLIGRFALSMGTGNYVKISAEDSGFTIADAVRFVTVTN